MNRVFVLLILSLFSFTTVVEAQTKLLYPQQQVLKRQTMNMNEIQKEIEKQQQQGANDAMNAAQQALMAQFNQMLKNDPNLKNQFDAATPEQQAAFMLQFGIIKPGGVDGDQFTFLLQRLDGIVNDIEGGGVPKDHPEVAALLNRVETARARISELQQAAASKTEQGLAANDTSDFPDFEKNLKAATNYAYALRDALLASRKISALASQRPAASETWIIENQINSSDLQRFKIGVSELAVFESKINRWTSQYQPLLARSQVFNGQWTEVATAFGQIAAAVKTESPQAVNVLADVINHNTEVMGRIIAPDANDAAGQRLATIVLNNRAKKPGIQHLDGLSQARRNAELALTGYPTAVSGGAEISYGQQQRLVKADEAVDAAVAEYAMKLVADQRMPADKYDGDDKDELKAKAVDLVKQQYTGLEVHSVAACCDWESTKYSEKVRESDGREVIRNYDYRDMRIGVALIINDNDAKIVVVGIRQNFISNKEIVEILAERPMLRSNL